MDEADLREFFSPKAGEKDLDEWMKAFCARKYDSGFSREMTRSVREYLRDYDPR
jgi:nitroreductase/FMN reductase (NADPH)/FMN reductase [NAD(P)H]